MLWNEMVINLHRVNKFKFMKRFFTCLIFIKLSVSFSQISNLYDSRDGKTYKTVKIGNQTWMAENLAYRPLSGNFFIYNNDPANVSKYGYLYDWVTACNVCPSGWRLPSNTEFLELTNYLGQDFKQKMMLKSAWSVDEYATNISGFAGLPAGMRDQTGAFRSMGSGGYFWTSTFSDQSFSFAREIGKNAGNWASSEFGTNQYIGMSVRCLEDQSSGSDSFSQSTIIIENLEIMDVDLGRMTWTEAIHACEQLGEGWRLPTIDELEDIYYNGTVPFAQYNYWSSTDAGNYGAWYFNFNYKYSDRDDKSNAFYVRPVRDIK
jgi:uncharacterized protein (TIGR02145 family)